jgi:prevent-host-death family protein
MTTVTASDLKSNHGDVLGRVRYGHERIVVTVHGKEAAAMVPMEDARLLERLEEALDALDALEAIDEAKAEGTISLAELRASLGR